MIEFRTSSHCATGACVEIGFQDDGAITLRDTKDPARTDALTFPADGWAAFVSGVRNGEFDLPT